MEDYPNVYFVNRQTNLPLYSTAYKVPWEALADNAKTTQIVKMDKIIDLTKYRIVLENDMDPPKESLHTLSRHRNRHVFVLSINDPEFYESGLPLFTQQDASEFVGMDTQQAVTLLKQQHPWRTVEATKAGVLITQNNFIHVVEKNGKVVSVKIM